MSGLSSLDPNQTYYTLDDTTGDYSPVVAAANKTDSAEDLSERHATLIRGQWDDWLTNGKPYEDKQFSYFTDPEKRQQLRGNALGYVRDSADKAYSTGLASMARRDERYGVQLTPDELASRNRKMQAKRQSTKAKGLSDMTSYMNTREMHMLSGGLSGLQPKL